MSIATWPILILTTLLTTTVRTDNDNFPHINNNELHHRKNNHETTDDHDTIIPTFHNLSRSKRKESAYWNNSPITNKEKESDNNNNSNETAIYSSESYLRINNRKRQLPMQLRWDDDADEEKTSRQRPERRKFHDAIEFGLKSLQELIEIKEPRWYNLGLYLDKNEPASHVARFGAPGKRALELSRLGYAALEASKKIAETYPENFSRQAGGLRFETRLLHDECPLRGLPRCAKASRRYRTADGTCNSFNRPWRGSALLPMQRFLPPVFEDGIQEIRRSVFRGELPSARAVSALIHRDANAEMPTVNLMLMQWGQLLDHDITSTVKSRSFNGSIPRCCNRDGRNFLPRDLTHPTCLPIEVPSTDWFLGPFGIRCIEFIRSAPSTRINCGLGWREQINQVTSYIDASTVYGSDLETSNSMRTFRRGKLFYGRPQSREPLQPPDPPGGELCRSGALTSDCLQGGDGRLSEQPGLTALHTVWLRYHNKVATVLGQINPHWSDEKIFQETRRIVVALTQHITYREFLPIILGQEVMELFELTLEKKGYYQGYDERVNPAVANSFSTAAFRFGHSLVQNSFVRSDIQHRPLFNNVSLHEEQNNVENIWSFGSMDRLLLGFCNQPSQRRDEFICDELTNHLFQNPGFPFGMDLAAINIQRGRDHGLPPYTSWREPCGLSPITNWAQLQKVINPETVQRLKSLYEHVDDIDLFTGGLAEKPVRGGIVGPIFACIVAQQFSNFKKGDRFWYENGGFESSFTPAQLQQIRHVTLAQILCQTLTEIETVQPFAFLVADNFRNARISCDHSSVNNFDLSPWIERRDNEVDGGFRESSRGSRKRKKNGGRKTTTKTPLKITITNITTDSVRLENKQYGVGNGGGYNKIPQRPTFQDYYDRRTSPSYNDVTYLVGVVKETTPAPKPIEVNIKIQYYPPPTTKRPTKKKRPTNRPSLVSQYGGRPVKTTSRPDQYEPFPLNSDLYSDDFVNKPLTTNKPYVVRPQLDSYGGNFESEPFSTSQRPYIYKPNSNHFYYSDNYPPTTKRPTYTYNNPYRGDNIDKYYSEVLDDLDYDNVPKRPSFAPHNHPSKYSVAHIEKVSPNNINDKLDFNPDTKFVKISSVRGAEFLGERPTNIELVLAQREGDFDLGGDEGRIVEIEVVPSDDRWVVFNATDETLTSFQIPDVTSPVACSNELPRPMTVTTDENDGVATTQVPETTTRTP